MTGEKNTVEFFFGVITYIGVIVAIIVRPDMPAHDKVLTVAMINALMWLGKLFFRVNGKKILELNEAFGTTINHPQPRQFTKEQLISSPKA